MIGWTNIDNMQHNSMENGNLRHLQRRDESPTIQWIGLAIDIFSNDVTTPEIVFG